MLDAELEEKIENFMVEKLEELEDLGYPHRNIILEWVVAFATGCFLGWLFF